MSGAIHPLPQYAFMAWCLVNLREKFTFTFIFQSSLTSGFWTFYCKEHEKIDHFSIQYIWQVFPDEKSCCIYLYAYCITFCFQVTSCMERNVHTVVNLKPYYGWRYNNVSTESVFMTYASFKGMFRCQKLYTVCVCLCVCLCVHRMFHFNIPDRLLSNLVSPFFISYEDTWSSTPGFV
jgi:hypothetical protein